MRDLFSKEQETAVDNEAFLRYTARLSSQRFALMTSIKGQIRNNTNLGLENDGDERLTPQQRLENNSSAQEGGMANMHARISKLNREISQID